MEFVESLFEATEGPRIPHPEDSIFDGRDAADRAVAALEEVIENPGKVTVKWDGGIALFFGNTEDGQFVITDKYMPSKGVYPTSPEGWAKYDQARGADRGDLYRNISIIWPGLKEAVGNTRGLFKGDLMWVGELEPNAKGQYVFRPTTVEYRVPASSKLGQYISGKVGGIVVHQFDGQPWDGKTGITSSGNVAILTPTAGISFDLKNPVRLVSEAKKALAKFGDAAGGFLNGLDKVAQSALKTYINKQITKQTTQELPEWLKSNISTTQYRKLIGDDESGYLYTNREGLNALYAVWNAIYRLKDNLVQQLEPQIKGFEQWTGGRQEGEGFVFSSSHGLIKLVNRAGFGAVHFANRG